MWRVASSGFDAHFAPGLTREMCQTLLIQHDLMRSAWIFERCRTRWQGFLHIFLQLAGQSASVTLERSSSLTPSVNKEPINIPLTKNKLSSLCNCGWLSCVYILSRKKKEVYLCLLENYSSTPTERDNKEIEWVFEHPTQGRALRLSFLLEV